jgi:putative RecB family exonuclease
VPVYSHSRLSSFEKCPLQYRFRYIDRIKRDTQGIEAFMGSRVHEAVEHAYREKTKGRVAKAGELVDLYHANWNAKYTPAVRIVRKGLVADDYRSQGETYVREYHKAYAPFEDGETLGIEEKFQFGLDPAGRYQVMGFIDRLARTAPGAYEVHDYKTGATLPSEEDLRRDRQLTLYQMAVSERYPDAREIRLVWHYLAHRTRLESRRTEDEIAAHRRATIRLIDTVEAARDYPARETALCRWCEYRDICPAQKDKLAAELAAEERDRRAAAERRLETGGRPITRAEQQRLIP